MPLDVVEQAVSVATNLHLFTFLGNRSQPWTTRLERPRRSYPPFGSAWHIRGAVWPDHDRTVPPRHAPARPRRATGFHASRGDRGTVTWRSGASERVG